MPDEKLRESIEALRAELDRLEAGETQSKERLDALIAGLEAHLEGPSDEERHHTLVGDIRESISHFEVSHPGTTAILNNIMVTLGNMGI